ncbi:MAG: hypothetical protein R2690_12785 [Acidimicrobiales bacterium]
MPAPEPPTAPAADIARWFDEHLPDHWFADEPKVLVDRDEILVLGTLTAAPAPDPAGEASDASPPTRSASPRSANRPASSASASPSTPRPSSPARSPGAHAAGDTRVLFTHLSVPVMTRLRIDERHILDTLVAAGVARSRSDALGWCVRLVAEHEGDWLDELRHALGAVEEVRARRPGAR